MCQNTWRLKKVAISLVQLCSTRLKKHNVRTHPARENNKMKNHPIFRASFKFSNQLWGKKKRAVSNEIQPEKQHCGIFILFRILNRLHKDSLFHLLLPQPFRLCISYLSLLLGPFTVCTSSFLASAEFIWPGCSTCVLPPLHIQLAHVTGTGLIQTRTSLSVFST